jgi:preprotein translocase subunit SecA
VRRWLEAEPELLDETLLERIVQQVQAGYDAKVTPGIEAGVRQYERYVMLQILDGHWREHLAALDHLRQGIHLRGYAQKNPKQEYKREAFELFGALLESVKLEVVKTLTNVQYAEKPPEVDDQSHVENITPLHAGGAPGEEASGQFGNGNGDVALAEAATKKKARPVVRPTQKVGRNDPCPCGSGKKYKHCHGKLT